jgi:hypothetical protein
MEETCVERVNKLDATALEIYRFRHVGRALFETYLNQ